MELSQLAFLTGRFAARLWSRLTLPLAPLDDDDQRLRSQLLAGMMLVVMFNAAVMAVVVMLVVDSAQLTGALVALVSIIVFSVPYFLSRNGHIQTAAGIATLSGVVLLLMSAIAFGGQAGLNMLHFLVTICVFAAIFISIQAAFWVSLSYSVLSVAILPLIPHVTLSELVRGPLAFNVFLAVFTLLIIYYWQQVERNRRQALEQSEQRYRLISEMTNDYTYAYRVQPDGSRVREWITEAFEPITGYHIDEVPPDNTDILFHSQDLPQVKADRERVMQGEVVHNECRFIRKDGRITWVSIKRIPAWNAEHTRVIGYYGVVTDISDRKRAEEQRLALALRSEQFSIVDRFVSAISHDFRTRLSVIENNRYLISRSLPESVSSQLHQRLNAIQTAVISMVEQLENLGMVTALDDPQPRLTQANHILDRLAQRQAARAREKGVEIVLEKAQDLPALSIDTAKLEQALNHLLTNAITHTPRGGRVTLRTRAAPEHLVIEVEDMGEGISRAEMQRIFEPFYRTDSARTVSRGGVGVGLTVVNMIVIAHHGSVEVESAAGSGSLFRVRLPWSGAAASTPEPLLFTR